MALSQGNVDLELDSKHNKTEIPSLIRLSEAAPALCKFRATKHGLHLRFRIKLGTQRSIQVCCVYITAHKWWVFVYTERGEPLRDEPSSSLTVFRCGFSKWRFLEIINRVVLYFMALRRIKSYRVVPYRTCIWCFSGHTVARLVRSNLSQHFGIISISISQSRAWGACLRHSHHGRKIPKHLNAC